MTVLRELVVAIRATGGFLWCSCFVASEDKLLYFPHKYTVRRVMRAESDWPLVTQ